MQQEAYRKALEEAQQQKDVRVPVNTRRVADLIHDALQSLDDPVYAGEQLNQALVELSRIQ